MTALGFTLAALASYLLGSIPTGYLVARARGLDIRKLGSGNIGATNVFRFLGVPAGVFVLVTDALKGLLAVVVVAPFLCGAFTQNATSQLRDSFALLAALCAVLGHNYTLWLGLKGGKGIATSAGVLAGLMPLAFLILLAIWAIVLATTRYMSLASITAACALPFAAWLTGAGFAIIVVSAVLSVLAVYRHKANIQRLLAGTENRFGRKPAPAEGDSPRE